MTNTHKKRLIGKDDEMDRDVIGKSAGKWGSRGQFYSSEILDELNHFKQ